MIFFALVSKRRAIRSLSAGLPGARTPDLIASSARSKRKSPLRAALSGPWQAKQFSAKIGRMSRLYSSLRAVEGAESGASVATGSALRPCEPRKERDKISPKTKQLNEKCNGDLTGK